MMLAGRSGRPIQAAMTTLTDDPQDTLPPSYAHRPRPFAGEVTFRLKPEGLVVDSGRRVERIPFGKIASVRLWYRPTNITSQGYRAKIFATDGRTVTLSNLSWKTYFEVERQDAAYRAFLVDLAERASAENPGFLVRSGQPTPLWLSAMALGLATLGMFATAIVWALLRQAWAFAGLAALFCLPFAWQAWNMAVRNRPAVTSAGHIPEAVLPPRS